MFEEKVVTALVPTTTKPTLLPQFNRTVISSEAFSFGAPIIYQDHFYVAMSNLTDATPLPPWIGSDFFYLPFSLITMNQTLHVSQQLQGYSSSTVGFGTEVKCTELIPGQDNNGMSFELALNGSVAQLLVTHQLADGKTAKCTLSRNGTGPNMRLDNSFVALEAMQTMLSTDDDTSEFCKSLFVAGWARGYTNGTGTTQLSTPYEISVSELSSTFIGCTAQLTAAHFDVLVDTDGRILRSEKKGVIDGDVQQFFKGNNTASALLAQSWALLTPNSDDLLYWHNDSVTSDWMNSLLSIANKFNALVDPTKPVPVAEDVGPKVEKLCRQLFAILLGLNTDIFSGAGDAEVVPGNIEVLETRLFMAPLMAGLCIAILALHLVTAVLYYALRPKVFLPRMPTSIAAIMSYVCASRVLEDGNKALEEQSYGYGRYVGMDGEAHVGIERQRYVVPWASENPDVKRRKWHGALGKKDETQPPIWI